MLDIVFKWANVKLNESSNTKLLAKVFDLFARLLASAKELAEPLQDSCRQSEEID